MSANVTDRGQETRADRPGPTDPGEESAPCFFQTTVFSVCIAITGGAAGIIYSRHATITKRKRNINNHDHIVENVHATLLTTIASGLFYSADNAI